MERNERKDQQSNEKNRRNQTGFRKGMGTVDIYGMNYLINKQEKQGEI